MLQPWTQLSASPRTVHVRWKSFLDHVDHAAPRAPGRWTAARPRKGTTRSRGSCGYGCPHVEEYEGSLVWPAYPSTHPHLMLFSGDGSRTSQHSYSPPRGQPLPCLPRLRVVPFVGLAVVQRPGALGAAWSTWSTNDTIGSRLCVESLTAGSTTAHKEMPPYYAQNNDSST